MMTLDEAWNWYETAKSQLNLLDRLAGRYWDVLPWEGHLSKDARFQHLDPEQLLTKNKMVLDELNDFAVLVLFSVFEAIIRDELLRQMKE